MGQEPRVCPGRRATATLLCTDWPLRTVASSPRSLVLSPLPPSPLPLLEEGSLFNSQLCVSPGVNFKSRRLKNDYSFHKKTNRKFCCFLVCYFVGWVGGLVGWLVKEVQKILWARSLIHKKRQVLKTSQIFGKWERNYKLNNSINSICLILVFLNVFSYPQCKVLVISTGTGIKSATETMC